MNEYYGVASTPMEDYLAHYGVKGMRWGVRKAIEKGNTRRLGRHYARAARKLESLTARTDRDFVSKVKRQNARQAVPNMIVSGLGSGALTYAINPHVSTKQRAIISAAVGGGAALGSGIGSLVDNARYNRMLSNKGHRKNARKRNEFEREMRKAFRGTQYAGQINKTKRNISSKLNTMKRVLSDPNERTSYAKKSSSQLTKRQQQDVNRAMTEWANAFEKHYQTGLSRGMTHEQAERYSNDYIAKNGFGSASNKRKRR